MRISELAKKADVSVRTIRYYIEEGLLPQPERKGPQTEYGPEYLGRLQLIAELKRAFLPLSEIRERIDQLSDGEIWELLREAAESDDLQVRVLSSQSSQSSQLTSDLSDLSAPPEIREPSQPFLAASFSPMPRLYSEGPPVRRGKKNPAKEYIERLLRDRVDHTNDEISGGPPPPAQWHRHEVADGLEVHVRGPLNAKRASIVQRLLRVIQRELRGW